MKLTDRRLYQAANLEDFKFRFYFRDEDNYARRNSVREVNAVFQQGFIPPDVNMIWGIDVSPWDGHVNLSVTKEYGASFVFVKAIDGTVPASYWAANIQKAQDVGLADGSYAWLYPDNKVSCVLQARAYWDLIKDKNSVLPPVIDFEWTRYAGAEANPNYTDLDKWVTEFTRISGRKPILYSAAGYMNMFGRMPDALRAKFRGFWFASYSSVPTLPTGFTHYDIWQFTSFGDAKTLAPGDRNKLELDLNYMAPAFYGMFIVPEPGEPMEEHYIKLTPNIAGEWRSIRGITSYPEVPHIYGATSTTSRILAGQFAKAIPDQSYTYTVDVWVNGEQRAAIGDKWWKVYEANGVPKTGWAAEIHLGRRYLDVLEVGAPAEPEPPAAGLPAVLYIGTEPGNVQEYRKAA